MMILVKILAAGILFFFATSTADIISVKIRSHNRDIILFSNFEFSHTGNVSVAVSSVGISSIPITSNLSQPDPSRMGFFLLSDEYSDRYDHEFEGNPDLCALDIKFISLLFTFRDLSPPPPQASFNQSYHVTYPGDYSLYFANCNDLSLVTMDVRTELYNIADDGTTIDYLSAGQPQPSFYFRLLLIYLCLLGFWICVSLKKHQCFQRIHLLMGVLLVITLLYLLCAAADQHDLKVTGTHHGLHALFYIFQFMRNVLFITVIYLIGAGWCFWKPFLLGCDRFNLWMVILLQIWANERLIAIGESGPYNEEWLDMIVTFTVIELMSCLVVIVHTLYSGNVAANEKSLSVMSPSTTRRAVFGVSVFLYIIYSRVLPIQLEIPAALEIGNLVFSMLMFYIYRPFLFESEDLNCKGFLDHTSV